MSELQLRVAHPYKVGYDILQKKKDKKSTASVTVNVNTVQYLAVIRGFKDSLLENYHNYNRTTEIC